MGFVISRAQLFVTPMDLPGSYVHGIPQARILQWVAMPSSKGSRVSPTSPALAGGFLTTAPPGRSVASVSRTV